MTDRFYDPTGDPRHIPGDFTPAPDRDFSEQLEENEAHIERLTAIQGLFDLPGWAHLVQIVAHDGDALDKLLTETRDVNEWKYLRGQKVWNDFILNLPSQISGALTTMRNRQRAFSAQTEEEN